MDQVATFVINLDTSTKRLAETETQLKHIGLDFTRLSAVDGHSLNSSNLGAQAYNTMGRNLTPGEIGCFQSHIKAAKVFLDTQAPLGLVLEDDIETTPQAMGTLAAFAQDWTRQPIWDVANLARPAKRYFTQVRPAVWSGPVPLYHAHYMPVTTTALLWTRGGAQAFLMMAATQGMRYPVDVQLQRWIAQTDRGLACQPAPFRARPELSTISTDRARRSQGFLGHQLRLRRIFQTHTAGLKARLRAQGHLK